MKSILVILLLLGSFAAFAQKHEMSVLNNRFYCVFPDSARNIARGTDIMAPAPNENTETRIVYDEGNKRLVFFAKELFVKSPSNLVKKLTKEATSENPFAAKTVYDKDAVEAVLLTPQKFDYAKKAILMNSLVVQNADGTLSRIDAYINPAAFDDRNRFQQIIDQAFAGFRPGERRLNLDAHTETLPIMGGTTKLQLKLPQGYVVTKDIASDFEVYRIEWVAGYDDKEASTVSVYFGFYPTMFNGDYKLTDFRKPDTKEDFMSLTRLWQNYNDPVRSLLLREQVFPADEIGKGMKIHVAVITNNPKRLEEMQGIVKDLKIVNGTAGGK